MQVSSDGKFRVFDLSSRVTVCEAIGQDWYDWGNDEPGEVYGTVRPAFIAYLGCETLKEANAAKMTIENICFYQNVEIRRRRETRTGWPLELKIRGLNRQGLEDLVSIGDNLSDYAAYSA